jgi:hypothetical protein
MPEYFIILYTGTELWEEYIIWLNKTYECNWDGDVKVYYGYDGHKEIHNGTYYSSQITDFKNSPEVITLEQWASYIGIKQHYEIY